MSCRRCPPSTWTLCAPETLWTALWWVACGVGACSGAVAGGILAVELGGLGVCGAAGMVGSGLCGFHACRASHHQHHVGLMQSGWGFMRNERDPSMAACWTEQTVTCLEAAAVGVGLTSKVNGCTC